MSDFLIENHGGSVVMVEPVTVAAKLFVSEYLSVEGWQWLGPRFAVDHRMIDGLADFVASHGYTMENA